MNYHHTPETRAAVAAMAAHAGLGVGALLVTGPPGVGKSALGDELARVLGAGVVMYQCHAWTDADELFAGVDVASAVAGDAATVRQPGVLAVAAEASHDGRVVLVIDELDKAPDRAEALLLDFLQTGRVPIAPGRHLRADVTRLRVVATSNGQRAHSDALMRRFRRVRIGALPADVFVLVVRGMAGALAPGVVTCAAKAARLVEPLVSPQEAANLALEASGARSLAEVKIAVASWAARDDVALARMRDDEATSRAIAALWGEVKAA